MSEKSLLDQFDVELYNLIEKYSGMELTCAETIGVLEFTKARIINQDLEDRVDGLEHPF